MILSLTGPSGVGKTTLLHNLVGALPHARPLMSYTTRAKRPSDEGGEYTYISVDEFERLARSGEFLWESRTTSNLYATKKVDVDAALMSGLYIPILVPAAAEKLYAYAFETKKLDTVKFLYIEIDDENELRKRLGERQESKQEAEARIAECRSWNAQVRHSPVPFLFIDGKLSREEMLANSLASLK